MASGCNAAAYNLKSNDICTMTTTTGIRKGAFSFLNIGVNEGNALGLLFENDLSGYYRRLACPENCFIIIVYSYIWRWRSLQYVFFERFINSSERQRVTSWCKIFVINSLQFKNLPNFLHLFFVCEPFATPKCFFCGDISHFWHYISSVDSCHIGYLDIPRLC